MKIKIISTLCVLFATIILTSCGGRKEPSAMEMMCGRLIPDHARNFIFEEITCEEGCDSDYFSIETRGNKVVIAGNNVNSQAVGLNYYLMNYCNAHVSWYASDAVVMPRKLPEVPEKVTVKAKFQNRFFLNYCTFGYTMPYWKWRDWERLIDWMVLNGVTMPLAITGQESVWYKVWSKLGLTDEQIRNYFTGPAQLPWHRMSNVDYWQSPLPMSWLDNQEQLQKQILERERSLGMTPVLPAFSGHVPAELAEIFPDAKIHTMSKWGGFDDQYRSHFIEPMDSLYPVIQKMYLEEQTALYGTDHIYGIDPFNEVESPDWSEDFLANVSEKIYSSLTQVDPEAIWLQMTWMFYYDQVRWTQPRIKAFVGAVPEGKLILLDYYCDHTEIYPRTENYYGCPFIWCYLGNFGGNTMLVGDINDVNAKINRLDSIDGGNMYGVGCTLEAFDVNSLMYEFTLSKAWDFNTTPEQWVDMWAKTRGGDKDTNIVAAWQKLYNNIYNNMATCGQAVLINARPMLVGIDSWNTYPDIHYDNADLLDIWDTLLRAEGVSENPGYKYDVINVGRQVMGNLFSVMRDSFTVAYNKRDIPEMERIAGVMNDIIIDSDSLLACDASFSLGKWIADARDLGVNPEEKDYYEQNARGIVTVWGQKATQLNDYANRGWAGLTKDFYGARWNKFTDSVIAAAKAGREYDAKKYYDDITEFEYQWTLRTGDDYPIVSDADPTQLAKQLINKYSKFITKKAD